MRGREHGEAVAGPERRVAEEEAGVGDHADPGHDHAPAARQHPAPPGGEGAPADEGAPAKRMASDDGIGVGGGSLRRVGRRQRLFGLGDVGHGRPERYRRPILRRGRAGSNPPAEADAALARALGVVHRSVGGAEERLQRDLRPSAGATPMLALISAFPPATAMGWLKATTSRSARASASSADASRHSTMNSSPPTRPTVSAWRTLAASRPATSTSARSPSRCPWASLTSLKPSRSMASTANGAPERRWARCAAERR